MLKSGIKAFLSRYPWLWGVTHRWFVHKDHIEAKTLTVQMLGKLVYSQITDPGGSSWYVYQRLNSGIEQVEDLGKYNTRRGVQISRMIRNHPGVVFIIELKWVGRGERMHRVVTLYEVPQCRQGSHLKSLCVKALEVGLVNACKAEKRH